MQKTATDSFCRQPAARMGLDALLNELQVRVGDITPCGEQPVPSASGVERDRAQSCVPPSTLSAVIDSAGRSLQELPDRAPKQTEVRRVTSRSVPMQPGKAGDPETLLQDQRRALLRRAAGLPESRRRAVQKTLDMLFDVQQARLRRLDRLQSIVSGDSSEARVLLVNQLAAVGFMDAGTLLDRFARLEHMKITGLVQALYPPETGTHSLFTP